MKRPEAAAAVTGEVLLDPLIDNMSKLLQNSGFRQIVLPPIEEARFFRSGTRLHQPYGQNLLSLHSSTERELVLSPTHLVGIHKLYHQIMKDRSPAVAKWFYILPVPSAWDKHMAVRHELGIFLLGDDSSLAYAQMVSVMNNILLDLGAAGFMAELMSRGCGNCQKDYSEAVRGHLGGNLRDFCADCGVNLEQDPAAVFACPHKSCQTTLGAVPQLIDFLDEPCRTSLTETLETIDSLEIPYALDRVSTNGVAAEKIVFDFVTQSSGRFGWGGNLTRVLDAVPGSSIPAVGFLSSLEELAEFLPDDRRVGPISRTEVFVVSLGQAASRSALAMLRDLRVSGLTVGEAIVGNQGIRVQLKEAQECKAEIALIVGQKEAMDETVILRDIKSGMQEVFVLDRIVEEVHKRLGK